ncbi:MAG: hypothetical protein HGB01_01485 [Chlorobiaceae bacterium]|nr:hypothetical protein [Chlorobiaceae bacterium]
MKKLVSFILCAVMLQSLSGEAAARQAVSLPSVFISSDSDGFSSQKYRAGYYPVYEHGWSYTGIEFQKNYYDQHDWDAAGSELRLTTKKLNPRNALGYTATVGLNTIGDHHLVTADADWAFRIADKTRGELIFSRDRIETESALEDGNNYTLAGFSLEQQLADRLTVIGMGGNMWFADSNTRPFVRFRVVYDLIPKYGITAQLRHRQYWDTDVNVPREYFNPERYRETMAAVGIRRRIEGWTLAGTAGYGYQKVNSDSSTPTRLFEVSVTSPIAGKTFFQASAGESKAAEFHGPDYHYRYLSASLFFSLD